LEFSKRNRDGGQIQEKPGDTPETVSRPLIIIEGKFPGQIARDAVFRGNRFLHLAETLAFSG